MADDISIVIKVVGEQSIVGAAKATKTLEGNVKVLSDALKKNELSRRQYYKGIEQLAKASKRSEAELRKYANELRKLEKASAAAKVAAKAEADAVKAYAQARREATEANTRHNAEAKATAAAAALVAREEERLKNKFVEGHTAMNIMSRELNDLALARKKDIISIDQQKAAVAQLNAQMKAGTGVFANAATGMQVFGKRANRTGMLAQQAGYQFGDFAVQVQSGTNPMVAFGQQATQLIGTFSMLARSTKMISIFAGLSVVIPILTGIGAYLMRAGKTAEDARSSVDRLKSSLEALESITFDGHLVGLGSFEEKWRSILALQREYITEQINLSRVGLFDELDLGPEINRLERTVTRIKDSMREGSSGPSGEGLLQFEADVKTLEKMLDIKAELSNLDLTNSETLARSFELALKRLTAEHDLTEEEKEQIALFAQKSGIMGTIKKEAEDLKVITEDTTRAADALLEKLRLIALSQADRLAMAIAERDYGKDSVEVARLRAEQEGISKSLVNDALQNYIAMELTIRDVEANTEASAAAAERFAAALEAANLAGQTLASLKFEFSVGGRAMGLYAGRGVKIDRDMEGDLPEGYGDKKPRGGGGADKFESELQQLRDFLATEKELLQERFEEKRDTLEEALQKRHIKIEEFNEMEIELERKKQSELGAIEAQTQKAKVSAIAGGIVDVLNAAANGNQKLLKMARIVGAAEALINTYRAAAQTLADPLLPFYAKFAAVASVVAAGFGMVNAIKSGSSSGGASGSAATMPSATQAVAQQRVIIEGIDKNSLFTGEQLSNIFDALYKENGDRGLVFEVAR